MGRLFGTDGVRGIANENLSCELMLALGRAAAMALSDSARRPLFTVGMDTRASSEMLACAFAAGVCSVGADVLMLGVAPTPAVSYLTGKYGADAGAMISASHNSAEFNGVKLFSSDGCKLSDALEERIEAIVLDRKPALRLSDGAGVGRVSVREGAVADYVDHLRETMSTSLSGMRIAVDCANGAASVTARRLLTDLGADCRMLFDRPDGRNINAGCGSTHLDALRDCVLAHGMDAGVAFDGDADRCLCVDGKGNVVDGDAIMAICALDLKRRGRLEKDTVVGTILSNMGFGRFCEENGIHLVTTKVGDRFVLEKMLQEAYNLGGEPSGHIIFRDFAATGDGQLTAIQLLGLLKREGLSLEDAAGIMVRCPQVSINVPVSGEGRRKFCMDAEVRSAIEAAESALGRDGRVVVRASGTEPLIRVMVEGLEMRQIQREAQRIAQVIRARLA